MSASELASCVDCARSSAGRLKRGRCPAGYSRARRLAALQSDPADLEPLLDDELARDTRRARIQLVLSNREYVLDVLRRPRWHESAACRGRTDLDWFADEPDPRALAICAACLVRDECGRSAARRPELVGIWAGVVHRGRPGSIAA